MHRKLFVRDPNRCRRDVAEQETWWTMTTASALILHLPSWSIGSGPRGAVEALSRWQILGTTCVQMTSHFQQSRDVAGLAGQPVLVGRGRGEFVERHYLFLDSRCLECWVLLASAYMTEPRRIEGGLLHLKREAQAQVEDQYDCSAAGSFVLRMGRSWGWERRAWA